MRGDIVYRVYGRHEGREKDVSFGTFRTAAEGEAQIEQLMAAEGARWAAEHHNRGFAIREAVVETDFEIPSRPKPRDKYAIRITAKPNRPGTWDSTGVEVCRRSESGESRRIRTKLNWPESRFFGLDRQQEDVPYKLAQPL